MCCNTLSFEYEIRPLLCKKSPDLEVANISASELCFSYNRTKILFIFQAWLLRGELKRGRGEFWLACEEVTYSQWILPKSWRCASRKRDMRMSSCVMWSELRIVNKSVSWTNACWQKSLVNHFYSSAKRPMGSFESVSIEWSSEVRGKFDIYFWWKCVFPPPAV